jgi:acetyl/propionyl-CoA carboxylase alpha subunit
MKTYIVRLESGEEQEVSVRRDGDRLVLSSAGIEHRLDLRRLPGSTMHLLLDDGASFDAVLEWVADRDDPFDGRVNVALRDQVYALSVLDRRKVRMRDALGGGAAVVRGDCCAPMPGKVLRVFVAAGDTVCAGQSLVVIEAMKMENELTAIGDGVVGAVAVEAGQSVEKGALLVAISEV